VGIAGDMSNILQGGGGGGSEPAGPPAVTNLQPGALTVGSLPATIGVVGSGFTADAKVHFGGATNPEAVAATTFTSSTSLSWVLPAGTQPEDLTVVVHQASGQSQARVFILSW